MNMMSQNVCRVENIMMNQDMPGVFNIDDDAELTIHKNKYEESECMWGWKHYDDPRHA